MSIVYTNSIHITYTLLSIQRDYKSTGTSLRVSINITQPTVWRLVRIPPTYGISYMATPHTSKLVCTLFKTATNFKKWNTNFNVDHFDKKFSLIRITLLDAPLLPSDKVQNLKNRISSTIPSICWIVWFESFTKHCLHIEL